MQELLEILEPQEFSQVVLPIQLLLEPQLKFLNPTVESTPSLILFKFQSVLNQLLLEPLDLLVLLDLLTIPLSTSQLEVIQILPIILLFKSLETKPKELQSTEIPSLLMMSNLELFSTDN